VRKKKGFLPVFLFVFEGHIQYILLAVFWGLYVLGFHFEVGAWIFDYGEDVFLGVGAQFGEIGAAHWAVDWVMLVVGGGVTSDVFVDTGYTEGVFAIGGDFGEFFVLGIADGAVVVGDWCV